MREIRLCNSGWKFIHEERTPETIWDRDLWPDIGLPHSFGIPYFMENEFYVGFGSYVKEFVLSEDDLQKRISLEFLGVFQVTEAYLNGEFIGRHEGGYTSFAFDLTDKAVKGTNILFVKVNNIWNARIAPRGGEHQFNGGIYRDVHLILTGRTYVERLGTFVRTDILSGNNATLSIDTAIATERPNEPLTLESVILFGGKEISSDEVQADNINGKPIRQHFSLSGVHPWTPETPDLYRLISHVKRNGITLDEYETTFGIRTVRFDKDNGFFLNGNHYDINGTNVHQDHAGWADAVTRSGITRDIQMIKDCGMNFIRGSHYPHHPFFAEECDRIGILFWSELCYWGTAGPKKDGYWYASAYPIYEHDDAPFEDNCMRTLEEMIQTNRNNPSVIIWSVCNEPFFSAPVVMDKARCLVKKLVEKVHELDPTRPAAVGGSQREGFDVLGDVAGYNGDGASLFINPGFPNFVSEYGSSSSFRPGGFFPNYTDNVDQPFTWRSGKALWCGFHHGSIIGDMGAMGMIDYYRLPLNTWHWYRQKLLGIPRPEPLKRGIPHRLRITSDVYEITTDGQQDAYLHIEVLDVTNRRISNELSVTLTVLEGDGIFPTGKSITFSPDKKSLLDGQAAIEFRSYYGGVNVIQASANGVESHCIEITALGEKRDRPNVPMTLPPYITPAPPFTEKYNLSMNKPVFASSFREGFEPANVTVSDDSYWQPIKEEAAWLVLDLEGSRTISVIEADFADDGKSDECTAYLSVDGRLYEAIQLYYKEPYYSAEGKMSFRYIKILLSGTQKGIREIRLWLDN